MAGSDYLTRRKAIEESMSGYATATQGRPMGFDATLLHFYETQAGDTNRLEIYGYTDRFSYAPGESVSLHVSTTADRYAIEVQRDGASPETVYRVEDQPGALHPTPADCSARGCGWPVSHVFEISADWPSGFYRIFLHAGRGDARARHEHFFVVRPEGAARRNRMLLVHATATWTAYNGWGGSSHYGGIEGPEHDQRSSRLSIQRPFERGFLWLPVGAPRIPIRDASPPGAIPIYPNFDFAYSRGFGKFYAAAGYPTFQRPFLVWAEQNGYDFDHFTQHDLDARPELLESYAAVVIVGHDEYWTREMREAIDGYVDSGGHVARFGANFMWQIRLEDEGNTQVCHWGGDDDPVLGTDRQHLFTSAWEDPRVGWPGARSTGLNACRGMYARISGATPRSSGGYTVYRPEHWAFEGTDLYFGDVFGGEAQLAGYEVDGVDYTFHGGLPHPTGKDGAPDNLEILAMAPATIGATERSHDGAVYFVGEADLHVAAALVLGEDTNENREKLVRGSGMMAAFERGRGSVFNAGTCEWVSGLIHRDIFTERITRNVLDRFARSE